MAWFEGTATDYLDLMDKLAEFASSDNVLSVAIDTAGTGYVVGDILTGSGGTATTQAQVEVLSVGGSGEITGLRVHHGGAYSAQPTNPVTMTGGTGSGALLNFTFQTAGWVINRQVDDLFVIDDGSIMAAGSGYAVNDIVTISSGAAPNTTATTEATFKVTAVSSGAVSELELLTPGSYTAAATDTLATTTGGSGTGLTLRPLFTGIVGEKQLLLKGLGTSGTDEIFVGARSYSVPSEGANNWELAGFTGFSKTASWVSQPGITLGRYDGALREGGAFLSLRSVTTNYRMSITAQRVYIIVQAGSNWVSAGFGLIDPLVTADQYPYPLFVIGSSSNPNIPGTSSLAELSGITDPLNTSSLFLTSGGNGPGFLRTPSGVWKNIVNGYMVSISNIGSVKSGVQIWPNTATQNRSLPTADSWFNTSSSCMMNHFIAEDPGDSPFMRLEPTPNTGGSLSLMFPYTLIDATDVSLLGQMPDLAWSTVSRDGASSAISDDVFLSGSDRYRVYQSGTRTAIYNFFAIRES